MEWFALIIPIFASIILMIFFHHKLLWWEIIPGILVGVITIWVFKFTAEKILVTDTEYYNGYVTSVWYYEPWSEWIDRTCTESYPCGTDANGNTSYCTRTYDCSYEKRHPKKWVAKNNIKEQFYITESRYNSLKSRFNNVSFVDMNRNYCCGRDGDAYMSKYLGEPGKIEHTSTKHKYENRVQASNSIFKFKEIKKIEADSLGLFKYPEIYDGYKQNHLLGVKNNRIELRLDYLNGTLGKKKQVKVFLLIFKDKPKEYFELQNSYWKGGNKNEFNIVMSIKNNKIQWSEIMTWSEKDELKIRVRNYLNKYKTENINYIDLIDFLYKNIDNLYKRKSFSDFDYLSVELKPNQLLFLYSLVTIITVIISIFMIMNDFKNNL